MCSSHIKRHDIRFGVVPFNRTYKYTMGGTAEARHLMEVGSQVGQSSDLCMVTHSQIQGAIKKN